MNPDNNRARTPEELDAEFQRKEAIRIANESGPGEATPPDISISKSVRDGSYTSDENFDNSRYGGDRSLENRDTNDGDANNENG